jgi:S1-C subfamily serine protease
MVEAMDLPVEQGILVAELTPDGPASKSGLRGGDRSVMVAGVQMTAGGDIIVAIDGTPVKKFEDLINYLATETSVGDPVTLRIVRDGQEREVEVVLEERPER